MEKPESGLPCDPYLRSLALEKLKELPEAQKTVLEALSAEQTTRLVHELQVHQIELQLQNEELRAVQARMDRMAERYRNLYDQAPVGYCTLSVDGVLLEANRTLARMLGREPETLRGLRLTALVVPEDQEGVYLWLKALVRPGPVGPAALRLRSGTGPFWARIEASPGSPEDGDAFRLAVSDISQERQMEENLRRAEKLEAMESLAGGIAHDFNNLLGGVYGYFDLAREAARDQPGVVRYLDKADAVFQRAKALTQRLMTFTKRNLPSRKALDLGPLVEKCTSFALSGTRTAVQIEVPPDLWFVSGDEIQLEQVLDNLTRNASQAMAQEGTVRVGARNLTLGPDNPRNLPPGPYVELTVQDTGPGIPSELMRRVFDPFFTTKTTGHGLGLATCHSIVSKHEGAIWAESASGPGARFLVLLPALTDKKAEAPPTLPPGSHQGTGTILLMDDEDFYRDILSTYLQSLGYAVVMATNGDEALEASQQVPNLRAALLDLRVPEGRGGKEIIQPLRKLHPRVPVIAISGFSEDPVMALPQAFGFAASLQKPFQFGELEALLEKVLRPAEGR